MGTITGDILERAFSSHILYNELLLARLNIRMHRETNDAAHRGPSPDITPELEQDPDTGARVTSRTANPS